MKNYSTRNVGGPGFGGYHRKATSTLRNYNVSMSEHNTSVIDYESMTSRDARMYTQTEFYKNILLENTREEREEAMKAKKLKNKGKILLFDRR
jgi:hypothetical protein